MPDNQYQQIAQELETGELKQDLWLEASAKTNGDYAKTKSLYISLRAEQIYRENTSFYKRSADTALHMLDHRTRRGRLILAGGTIGLVLAIYLGVQPFLRRSASREFNAFCQRIRQTDLLGQNPRFMFEQFGEPDHFETGGNSLAYIYNPSSAFCLGRKVYEIRIFVDVNSGRIVGWHAVGFESKGELKPAGASGEKQL